MIQYTDFLYGCYRTALEDARTDVVLLLLLVLCGSVYLSMPRHDYVKSGRLAVTEKTKPINIYLHI